MFSRRHKTERTAAQAWEYLLSAMAAAGESAREAGRYTAEAASSRASEFAGRTSKRGGRLAGKASQQGSRLADMASSKVNSVADEAWARANAAADALAGRKPGLPWGLIAGFGLIGAALGWAAATTARAVLERQAENEQLELADTTVVVTPTYDS